ncbi:MAG: hypothetical protein GX308_01315 [Epulopiscium sp.]|nr:hypothetical protein [Candidatus Epulonipiscium sp.]
METINLDSLKQGKNFSIKLKQGNWSKAIGGGIAARLCSEGGAKAEIILQYPSMTFKER